MFTTACEKGRHFTRPVATIWHCVDGKCRTSVGSYVVINRDGWFLSAYHIHKFFGDIEAAKHATIAHQARIAAVVANHGLAKGARRSAFKQLGAPAPDAPLSYAIWWSRDGVKAVDVSIIPDVDLMLGRLDPFDPAWVTEYPVFKDPTSPISQGTSLCRLGYPFPEVDATYDATSNAFAIKQAKLPIFPIEGILTRHVYVNDNAAGYRHMFIETSSPGLKGQSGGPILDTAGKVWGIQSKTINLSLGFDPVVPAEDGKSSNRKEHQFLNVGWASHPESVVGLLKEKGIAHTIAP